MVGQGQFTKLVDKATSQILLEPDLEATLSICDIIRQGDVTPKVALGALKKKLTNSANPHILSHTLAVLESVVKNCPTVHEELTSRAFLDILHDLMKSTTHANIRNKILELIQAWSQVFKNNSKFEALHDIVSKIKAEGYKFPTLRESEAMFTATNAPSWVDGDSCHRCREQFSMITRKHHCRACGQVFCSECSKKNITLPKFGIEKEVRVCDSCYAEATKVSTSKTATKTEELPFEYLKSSLFQQKQQPAKKNSDEIQEEEELQLAIALSQSEAECKEKERAAKLKASTSPTYSSFKTETRPVVADSTPQDDDLNPELLKYLNRPYWESRTSTTTANDNIRPTSPSAPSVTTIPLQNHKNNKENGVIDNELEDFMNTLHSQVEIFINRMKSNSSRGRSIANDTSVQTLFMNITAMHSKLVGYIKEHDDSRLHFERLQDKLNQVKDARAALDALREEHRDKMRLEAEEAERLRQRQMAQKLDIMRKKKQEYLQYQRQLVLQRVQEQEREMQMRQEQQKQAMMGNQQFPMGYMVHQYPNQGVPQMGGYFVPQHSGMVPNQQMGHMVPPGYNPMTVQANHPQAMPGNPQVMPGNPQVMPGNPQAMPGNPQAMSGNPQAMQGNPQGMPGNPQGIPGNPPAMPGNPQGMSGNPQGIPGNPQGMPGNPQGLHGNPQGMQGNPQMQQMGMPYPPNLTNQQSQIPNQGMMGPRPGMAMHQFPQQPGAPPASPQQTPPQAQHQPKEETQTAELISFD